jgi:hypothetical protein
MRRVLAVDPELAVSTAYKTARYIPGKTGKVIAIGTCAAVAAKSGLDIVAATDAAYQGVVKGGEHMDDDTIQQEAAATACVWPAHPPTGFRLSARMSSPMHPMNSTRPCSAPLMYEACVRPHARHFACTGTTAVIIASGDKKKAARAFIPRIKRMCGVHDLDTESDKSFMAAATKGLKVAAAAETRQLMRSMKVGEKWVVLLLFFFANGLDPTNSNCSGYPAALLSRDL